MFRLTRNDYFTLYEIMKTWFKRFLLIYALFLAPLFGEGPPEQETTPQTPQTSQTPPPFEEYKDLEDQGEDRFTRDLMQMLASLGLLLAVVLIGTWFLKRMMHSRLKQLNTTSEIKIIEHRALTPKTSIYLLEIRGKGIVMAESVNGVTALADFIPSESDVEEGQNPSTFSRLMQDKTDQDKKT